jgi:hypothetical protein
MAAVLQFTDNIMANQNSHPAQGTKQQGDNRQAGDVDGNRGAKPKTGTQGVNETAANKADGTQSGGRMPNPASDNSDSHSEAEALYREEEL